MQRRGFIENCEESNNEFELTHQWINNSNPSTGLIVEMDESRLNEYNRDLLAQTQHTNDDYLLMSNIENAELIYKFAGSLLTSETSGQSSNMSHKTSHFVAP